MVPSGPVARGISPFARWIENSPPVLRVVVHCKIDLGLPGQLIVAFKRGPNRQWADSRYV
jgi:hypothetical protein